MASYVVLSCVAVNNTNKEANKMTTITTLENNQSKPGDDRPELIKGHTYKIKTPNGNDQTVNVYVTINNTDIEIDGNLVNTPYEIFVNCSDQNLYEMASMMAVLVSNMLQEGISPIKISDLLETIHSTQTGHMVKGGYCPSFTARIARVLHGHYMNSQND